MSWAAGRFVQARILLLGDIMVKPVRTMGFTLLEMLVALVITSMLIALITGALFYVLQVREKLGRELVQGTTVISTQSWFETIVAGCLPVPSGEGSFAGDDHGFKALTQGALRSSALVPPVPIELRLENRGTNELRLEYKEGERLTVLARWENAEAHFRYYDSQGEGRDAWKVPVGTYENLMPRLIELEVKSSAGRELYLAAIQADAWAERPAALPFN